MTCWRTLSAGRSKRQDITVTRDIAAAVQRSSVNTTRLSPSSVACQSQPVAMTTDCGSFNYAKSDVVTCRRAPNGTSLSLVRVWSRSRENVRLR